MKSKVRKVCNPFELLRLDRDTATLELNRWRSDRQLLERREPSKPPREDVDTSQLGLGSDVVGHSDLLFALVVVEREDERREGDATGSDRETKLREDGQNSKEFVRVLAVGREDERRA